jgi:hypothetical protein
MSLLHTTMIARRTESASLLWGRRQRRNGRGGHDHSTGTASNGSAAASIATVADRPASPNWESSPRARRQGGPSQDHALYACSCGYVFPALVSTSVDCPACGDIQAW